MTVLTQGKQTGEFLLSEANGDRSREVVTVTVAGAVALPSGQVLGKLSATGKYVAYNNAGAGGAEIAAAVLLNACPGTNGDYKCTVFVRDCEVWESMLTGIDSAGKTDLTALGVIVR